MMPMPLFHTSRVEDEFDDFLSTLIGSGSGQVAIQSADESGRTKPYDAAQGQQRDHSNTEAGRACGPSLLIREETLLAWKDYTGFVDQLLNDGRSRPDPQVSVSRVFRSLEDLIEYAEHADVSDGDGDVTDSEDSVEYIDQKTYKKEIKDAIAGGRLTKRQGKKLQRTISRLQEELMNMWAAGKNVEAWLQDLESAADLHISEGYEEVNVFGEPNGSDPSLIGNGRWLRIKNRITVESGCSVFVVPSDWLKMFKTVESEGQRRGQQFSAAAKDGKPILNEGQKLIEFVTDQGKKKAMLCQVARVNKILASVALICDRGNHVLFRSDGGDIINLKSKVRTPFRRHGNVYVLDAWVESPDWRGTEKPSKEGAEVMGFTRQGGR